MTGELLDRLHARAWALVAQGAIRPPADGRMRELNLFQLPWAKAELEALADLQ